MKKIRITCCGLKALFRNPNIPYIDTADTDIKVSAVEGIIACMIGTWRDFDSCDTKNYAWENFKRENDISIENIKYSFKGIRTETRHYRKELKAFNSSQNLTKKRYHTDVTLSFVVSGKDSAIEEIKRRIKIPCSSPYLGQSECSCQVVGEYI